MNVEVDPKEFFSTESNYQLAKEEAKNVGLPVIFYALKYLDSKFTKHVSAEETTTTTTTENTQKMKTLPSATTDRGVTPIKLSKKFNNPKSNISELGLSGYCTNPLINYGLKTIEEVLEFSNTHSFGEIPRFGLKSETELRNLLTATDEDDEWEEEEEEEEDDFEDDDDDFDDEYDDDGDFDEDAMYASSDAVAKIMELDRSDKNSLKGLVSIYSEAWGLSAEDGKTQMGAISKRYGFKASDESTYQNLYDGVIKMCPKTDLQVKAIKKLGEQLGEDFEKFTTKSRTETVVGSSWGNVTFEDANTIIQSMREELETMSEMSSDLPDEETENWDF